MNMKKPTVYFEAYEEAIKLIINLLGERIQLKQRIIELEKERKNE